MLFNYLLKTLIFICITSFIMYEFLGICKILQLKNICLEKKHYFQFTFYIKFFYLRVTVELVLMTMKPKLIQYIMMYILNWL